jgi:hypothetical protein
MMNGGTGGGGGKGSREVRGGRGGKGRPPIEEDWGRCARYQLVAAATYLADSVALILRLGHETRCLYAAFPVEAAAADASF